MKSTDPQAADNVIKVHLLPIGIDPSSVLKEGDLPIQLYNLDGPLAKRMIDLQLHKVDLNFVAECLKLLTHQHVSHTVESEAIWTAAMVRFFKCFAGAGQGGRSQLSPHRVFRTEPGEAMVSFARLETLRNKTVVHDQNSFMQGTLGVPIAFPPTGKPRMGPLQFMSFVATTLDDESVSNMTLLTQRALVWIDVEYAQIETLLVAQLMEEKLETTQARGPVLWTAPSHETAGVNKQAVRPNTGVPPEK